MRSQNNNRCRSVVSLALLLLAAGSCFAAVPDWLRVAAERKLPAFEGHPEAVILLDERSTFVDANGEITTTVRRALKILRPSGLDWANLYIPFDSETKILSSRAWSRAPGGREYELKEKDAQELPYRSFELYSDARYRHLQIPAETGTVLGYEYQQRKRPYVYEDGWYFQHSIPVLYSRFSLHLPDAWEFKEHWINYPGQKSSASLPGRWVWELDNVPALEDEDGMPDSNALLGGMVVQLLPLDAERRNRSFANWKDIGAWYSRLTADRLESTPEMKRKVSELTASATTPMEKIQALANYVQRQVRYVAIEIGIGGYRPHKAAETLRYQYGDCKDKATLLSAMLREVGVASYYLLVDTDRGVVAADVPSVRFNHAILAIELPPDAPRFAASFQESKRGNLLFFDPTSDVTPLGELPYYLQAGYGLLVRGGDGELVQLPLAAANTNRLQRNGKFYFGPAGELVGEVDEIRSGSLASTLRAQLWRADGKEKAKLLEQTLAGALPGFSLQRAEITNLHEIDQNLVLHYRFLAGGYAKKADNLLMFRPRVLGIKRRLIEQKPGKTRKFPVEIPYRASVADNFEIELPSDYQPDELPQGAALNVDFGAYKSSVAVDGGKLRYTSDYELKMVLIPSERLAELNGFYTGIEADEVSTAVFKLNHAEPLSSTSR